MTVEIKGWIRESDHGDSSDVIFIDDLGRKFTEKPLTDQLGWISGKKVTVYYYITDKKCTLEEAQEQFLKMMYAGKAKCEFHARYSDITGYLWTDENLVIGGHDLLEEIRSHLGSYLILEIEVHASR